MSQHHSVSIDKHMCLAAIDFSRNIEREYEIYAAIDLFGAVVVDYHWGRRGTKGQGRRRSFGDNKAASKFVNALLRRRSTAKKRIGVAYRFNR